MYAYNLKIANPFDFKMQNYNFKFEFLLNGNLLNFENNGLKYHK